MLICSVQLASLEGESKEQRLHKAENYLRRIGEQEQKPTQILFPELWATGFFAFDNYYAEAETDFGDIFDLMSAWAMKLGCYILSGSFVEKSGSNYYNTNLLISPQGRIAQKYRKMHLFGHDSQEAQLLSPGDRIIVSSLEYGQVAVSTCYDLRFPEIYRTMVSSGAEIFLVSSAWPRKRLEHWLLLNRVRALENQCYLLSANGVGDVGGQELAGHSLVIDPTGQVMADAGGEETLLFAHIDPAAVVAERNAFPVLEDMIYM